MKIAICGPICSGKTYLSDYLQNNYNLRKYAFGDKVKEIANDLFNMKYKNRKLLQTIADKMREIDKDIWAKYVIQQIEHLDNIIIEDLRFVNEAKYLQTLGFIIIKLPEVLIPRARANDARHPRRCLCIHINSPKMHIKFFV